MLRVGVRDARVDVAGLVPTQAAALPCRVRRGQEEASADVESVECRVLDEPAVRIEEVVDHDVEADAVVGMRDGARRLTGRRQLLHQGRGPLDARQDTCR